MSNTQAEAETSSFVSAPYLNDNALEDREYQSALVESAQRRSTLIALPTGTGKTAVAARIAAHRLNQHGGKILFLAPTQPLVQQHAKDFREWFTLPDHEIKVFTGDISPDERAEKWNQATSIVIATPQCIENDLVGNQYTLEDVCYCVFDECHRATGKYAYKYIAERYNGNAMDDLVTGMSASPGSNKESILNVATNLGLTNIEVITEDSDLLAPYLHDVDVNYTKVELPPEITKARDILEDLYTDRLDTLKNEFGVINSRAKDISFKHLMKGKMAAQDMIDNDNDDGYAAMSVHAQALKLHHALSTIESQGGEATLEFFNTIETDASKGKSRAAEEIANDYRFKEAKDLLQSFEGTHPKLKQLRMEVVQTLIEDGQILVFTESRDTVNRIVDFLESHNNIKPARFVGQADKGDNEGMSQGEQKETLDAFRAGEHNVLVATSVAEEGIDIPSVDLVLFYEPVASGIRSIQRRGRTGRRSDGRVVVLMAEDTRDINRYWAAQNREDTMKDEMESLKNMEEELSQELRDEQAALSDFGSRMHSTDHPVVVIDQRETQSTVPKHLDRASGVQTDTETLQVGDYVMSERVAAERKTLDDFIDSLTGERSLFDQFANLANNYEKPVLILEGEGGVEGLYGRAKVDKEAINGALEALAIDFGASVIPTVDEKHTADIVGTIARREQDDRDHEVQLHEKKQTDTLPEQQEYLVASMANIGPVIAENLLEYFGSPRAVFTASKEELEEVEKVGEATAAQIQNVLNSRYSE
ncbi:DEAD/DEAH box helicase [Salinibaculum rarum]|uniref:DEAD/DEAH box helicase n=1 Tax=Salinibaculum rarum TaxID=3058903 RepID=UPI0026603241|nr:DEAD/DEAH box helicase [Salinibaculum sp. KK48]